MKYIRLLLITVSLIIAVSSSFSQFGKNKVQYQDFDWKFIQSKHFDIYYYDSTYNLAVFTALNAEKALDNIQENLHYSMTQRVSIVVHNSHNEFQQTNIVDAFLPKGVGGVTELYKNRVVLPFMGNFSQFRHVIHHELVHAVLNDMFYGGTLQTAISTNNLVEIPIWMNEGLAEFLSIGGLDINTDMFMRDVSLTGNIADLKNLSNYYAYRGGQAFYWYVADKYGTQKVGDLVNRLRATTNADRAFKSTFNLSLDEFSEQWKKDMKKFYLPDIDKYKDPEEYAIRVTNHKDDNGFYNSSPAISPSGDKMAYISDRAGNFDIYVQEIGKKKDAKKLVSSFRESDFEELNVLTPGISWSPDSKKLAISAKAGGGEDAIFIVDAVKGKYEKILPGFNSIISVNWSPDGSKIAFVGLMRGKSDIYIYDIAKKTTKNLTEDVLSDHNPVWSWDSKQIFFISDRENVLELNDRKNFSKIWNHNFEASDIYSIDIESQIINRITNDPENLKTSVAVSPDNLKLLHVSGKNGIGNIYEFDIMSRSSKPKTNSLTGITQLSITPSGGDLLFCSQYNGKFDIFQLRNPFSINLGLDTLPLTKFKNSQSEKKKISEEIALNNLSVDSTNNKLTGYGNFDIEFSRSDLVKPNPDALQKTEETSEIISPDMVNDSTFTENDYKVRFTTDIVMSNPSYNTFSGYQGTAQVMFSDILGNNRIYLQLGLWYDLRNSNIVAAYYYLPKMIDYTVMIYHNSIMFYDNYNQLNRIRNFGANFGASYPLDLFNRFDFNLNWLNVTSDNVSVPENPSIYKMLFIPSGRYVHDNTIFGFVAPVKGTRYSVGFMGTPKYSENSIGFLNVDGDFRYYLPLSEYVTVASRLSAGASFGPDERQFFLGGTENWINRQFGENGWPFSYNNPEDYAFMNFVMPLRGFPINEISGDRYFASNIELRFPIIFGLLTGSSTGFLQGILGSFFFDIGGAWNGNIKNFRSGGMDMNKVNYLESGISYFNQLPDGFSGPFDPRFVDPNYSTTKEEMLSEFQFYKDNLAPEPINLLFSTGVGLRANLLGLPFKLDVAWSYLYRTWSTPWYMVSLGYDF